MGKNRQFLSAWKKGLTGYPIVDGNERITFNWLMHNRVRMIVGSFLVKHLLINWKEVKNFKNSLLDYNEASNVAGWQWLQVMEQMQHLILEFLIHFYR